MGTATDAGPARPGAAARQAADAGGRLGPRRPAAGRRPARHVSSRPGPRDRAGGLRAVRERDAYVNLELPRLLRERGLAGRDAAFATELTHGTIRRQGTYDAVLAACLTRPIGRTDPELLDVLRLGCHQLLALGTPPHAAVSTSVALARQARGQGAGRLTNAVLRKVAGRDLDELAGRGRARRRRRPGRAPGRRAQPPGVDRARVPRRAAATGREPGARRPAGGRQRRPGRHAGRPPGARGGRRARRPPVRRRAAGRRTPPCWPAATPVRSRRYATGGPGCRTRAASSRCWRWPRLPSRAATSAGSTCVPGPGGKAALLGALAAPRGARGWWPTRSRRTAPSWCGRRSHRCTASVEVRTGDGREAGRAEPAAYDRVLVDAPCTGLGALRRRPEARWRRQPSDLDELGRLQRALLTAALDATRPGGVVAYVTCSPHLAETRAVVSDVLAARADAEPLDTPALLPRPPRPARPVPAAVAAPARHRRDVRRPAPPGLRRPEFSQGGLRNSHSHSATALWRRHFRWVGCENSSQ